MTVLTARAAVYPSYAGYITVAYMSGSKTVYPSLCTVLWHPLLFLLRPGLPALGIDLRFIPVFPCTGYKLRATASSYILTVSFIPTSLLGRTRSSHVTMLTSTHDVSS